MASRAWWVLLLAMGPLVGVTFISAVRTYGEASGLNGTTAGVGEAFSPLIGIWAPTFSACEVAAVFLLPFVAIRLVSGDRQSGALKIEMQHPMPTIARVAAKAIVLLGGWMVASLAPFAAALLWKSYGGSVYAPELLTVAFGHMLNAGLTIALASAAAALTEHPSTAAILTLSVTVGTWILNFIAAVQGGIWERLAGYTPPAMVAQFQHGLIRLDAVLIALALVAAGLVFAALWLRLGVQVRRRVQESIALAAVVVLVVVSGSAAWPSWDLSENRMNSFPEADEHALAKIRSPLGIEVHLAPEDPQARRSRSQGHRQAPARDAGAAGAVRVGDLDRPVRADGAALRRDLVRARRQEGNEPRHHGRERARDDLRPRRRQAAGRNRRRDIPGTPAGGGSQRRGRGVLRDLARLDRTRRIPTTQEIAMMNSRQSAVAVAAILLIAPLGAADLRVDLSKETVGKPPATFEPMVGTWVVAQDGADKVIMIDGRPWVASKDNPTKLLIESARKLYGTSNEELMDNAKQFAYFPVAVLRGLDNFTNGTISVKFKTIAGDADRASGILFNVKPNGDWLAVRYNDTENNVALWEFHNGIRRNMRFSDRAHKFMLDRAAWHELKLTIDGADLKTTLDGELALEYTLGSQPGPGRNNAPPNPDLVPANNAVLRPPVMGKVGVWAKTDTTSYFKDYVVSPK